MNNAPTTVNFDLGTLLDGDILILAAETEDDIGCILRLHLQVEQMLDFYLSIKRTADIAPFVREPRDFSGKLSISVALGLPLSFASVAKEVNSIRNRLAHEHKATINPDAVKQLVRTVNAVRTLLPDLQPVERRWIELPQKRPNKRYTYGEGEYRLDFFLAVAAFLGAAVPWLITQFAPEFTCSSTSASRAASL
ncbi:hypothetical protein LV28_22885 [Pandoraea pnomenusa]|uniref:DUF4145 domain-containing protein n=1 Tax=Pandoraea pnomenusa TaxID=93220 RepID=A0A378YWT9_9BURK|nr:hypothetical protein [Pandoraea pnomenusa]ALR36006.1 hypothetical protein LV28_22885 [Pandoraea pnomenusa]SUA81645.1 Uncharacterised protein [Pandoraea pnomenusa]